mmetsp:Transcript_22202/g.53799  ORF Transcript_22202/g.53799 Transcript_22202/m.53799 type:complete len:260 (-) Transcript_22202:1124-1903(-)
MPQQLTRSSKERGQLCPKFLRQRIREPLHVCLRLRISRHLLCQRLEQPPAYSRIRQRLRQSGRVAESLGLAGRLVAKYGFRGRAHVRGEVFGVLQVKRSVVLLLRALVVAKFSRVGVHVAEVEFHQLIVLVVADAPRHVGIVFVRVRESDQPSHLPVASTVHLSVIVVVDALVPRALRRHAFQVDARGRFRGMENDGPVPIVLVDDAGAGRIPFRRGVQVLAEEARASLNLGGGGQVELPDREVRAELLFVVVMARVAT